MMITSRFLSLVNLIALLLTVIAVSPSIAQLVYIDGVSVRTNTGAQITVKGSLEAVNLATLSNDGTIDMTGDIINNSGTNLFNPVSGTVVLNGALQNIDGTDIINFFNLTINGTGNKVLSE